MKRILYILLILLPFVSCKKSVEVRRLSLSAVTDSAGAWMEIDDVKYPFEGFKLQREILLNDGQIVSTLVMAPVSRYIHMELNEGDKMLKETSGFGSAWMIISNSKISTNTPANVGGTGTWCPSVLCSGRASTGAQCNRMTTSCNGRCSIHW